jgi:hypothetical protein
MNFKFFLKCSSSDLQTSHLMKLNKGNERREMVSMTAKRCSIATERDLHKAKHRRKNKQFISTGPKEGADGGAEGKAR